MGSDAETKWDLILRPKNSWYDIDLKGVWHYRDLILLFVKRDFINTYKQTVLGPLWMLIQPLISTIMFAFIFGMVAKIPTGDAPRLLFYMSAFVPWTYFSDCMNKTSNTFSSNATIFGKVYFPRLVTPISVIISNLFKYLVQCFLLMIIYVYYVWNGETISANHYLIFMPFLIILLGGFGMSLGLIISAVTTKYRDLTFLIAVGTQLLMYGSSVVFSIEIFGPELRSYLVWNPFVWIMEACRFATIGVGEWSWGGLAYSAGCMMILMFLSIVVFSRVEKNFMDTV